MNINPEFPQISWFGLTWHIDFQPLVEPPQGSTEFSGYPVSMKKELFKMVINRASGSENLENISTPKLMTWW